MENKLINEILDIGKSFIADKLYYTICSLSLLISLTDIETILRFTAWIVPVVYTIIKAFFMIKDRYKKRSTK